MQKSSTIDIDPVIYLAIELSASTWLVVSKIPTSEKTGLHRMEAGDSQALLALIADLRKKVAAKGAGSGGHLRSAFPPCPFAMTAAMVFSGRPALSTGRQSGSRCEPFPGRDVLAHDAGVWHPLLRWSGHGRRCKRHGPPWRERPGCVIAPGHRADRFWRAWRGGSPGCSSAPPHG